MDCSTISEDITGVARGRCSDCDCAGFRRTAEVLSYDKLPPGWCILCGHSPAAHASLTTFNEAMSDECWEPYSNRISPMETSLMASADPASGSSNDQAAGEHTSDAPAPERTATTVSSRAQETARELCRKWDNNFLPSFSTYLNPLLHGEEMHAMARRRMTAQLRDEVIEFLDENNLIESSNPGARRWKYCAFAEALHKAYPRMVWERKGTSSVLQLGWIEFMRSVSSTRKTRKLRAKQSIALTSNTSEQSTDISCTEAQHELRAISETVTDPDLIDLSRMKMLLHATIQIRKQGPVEELPVYFLNAAVLGMEAEIRFGASLHTMESELHRMLEKLSFSSFVDIDSYLRPNKAAFALISMDQHDTSKLVPGPCVVMEPGSERIVCKKQTVHLLPGCSVERGLILCLVIYFILDLSYPHAFGQTLGFLQTILVKNNAFEQCFMSHRLKALLKQLDICLTRTSHKAGRAKN